MKVVEGEDGGRGDGRWRGVHRCLSPYLQMYRVKTAV